MDLQTLRFFIAAAEAGSLSAAADSMHYAQSNLSSRIRQLEEEIGEQLFYRHKRGVILTAKGQVLYEYAQRVLKLSDEAVTVMRDMDHARGKLALGSLEAIALIDLPQLLAAYHKQCPDVSLSLQTDMNDVFLSRVLSGKLDGAFVCGPVNHPSLSELFFKHDELILVGSSEGQAEDVLSGSPLITFPEGSAFRRHLELLLSSRSLPYTDNLIVLNSLGAMIAGICAGIGCGYLPRSVTQSYIEKGIMKEYPLEDPFSPLDFIFIYRKDRIMDAAFRTLLDSIRA